jgi:hypothetical protein
MSSPSLKIPAQQPNIGSNTPSLLDPSTQEPSKDSNPQPKQDPPLFFRFFYSDPMKVCNQMIYVKQWACSFLKYNGERIYVHLIDRDHPGSYMIALFKKYFLPFLWKVTHVIEVQKIDTSYTLIGFQEALVFTPFLKKDIESDLGIAELKRRELYEENEGKEFIAFHPIYRGRSLFSKIYFFCLKLFSSAWTPLTLKIEKPNYSNQEKGVVSATASPQAWPVPLILTTTFLIEKTKKVNLLNDLAKQQIVEFNPAPEITTSSNQPTTPEQLLLV